MTACLTHTLLLEMKKKELKRLLKAANLKRLSI